MTTDPIWFNLPPRAPRVPLPPPRPAPAILAIEIDGKAVEVEA
ncbi:MAG: hypothetical protein QG573_91, partial [Acidobacteriota bacterium]|nr:hypothetical protein [Acidobacteriota bacterium]